ncbi:hypothetical protein [Brevibacillus sp. NRS-1366]|uniref:hypothetical protein n=1 Tax=Brevibacillus sp. NRS-1366 TaxID=3233899 RepID=UPI003D22367B
MQKLVISSGSGNLTNKAYYTGGHVGRMDTGTKLIGSFAETTITGSKYSEGLVGANDVGGLVGTNENASTIEE